jgi:hypothetical protein
MFAYNPTVNDMSGQIMAQGQVGAAQSNAQMMGQLGQDIGGALASIGGMYAENKGLEAKAKGYDQVGKILGDSMFKNNPAVGTYLSELRNVKNPMERISGYETLFGLAGPLSNAMMAQGRFGLQQQAPYVDQMLDNQRDVGSGNQTITPGSSAPPVGASDPANTVPLPEADAPLPAVRGAPGAAPSVPGGRASWDARNRDRQKSGLQPLPYPPGLE